MIIKFKKSDNIKLSEHFNSNEFECPCDKCDNDDQLIDSELIAKLEKSRIKYGKRVKVTSGYRCPAHNAEVGGKPGSAHMSGLAADIQPSLMNLDELDLVYDICYDEFDNIGDGRRLRFIHVDVRPAKPDGKRKWIY